MNLLAKMAPAVRKEVRFIAVTEAIGVCIMIAAFAVLHFIIPEKVPFNAAVIAAGIIGGFVAWLNFFLMGITVQKAASMTDEADAGKLMRSSYSRRMLLQMGWAIVAIAAPVFQFAAGIIPLLFPGMFVKLRGLKMFNKDE